MRLRLPIVVHRPPPENRRTRRGEQAEQGVLVPHVLLREHLHDGVGNLPGAPDEVVVVLEQGLRVPELVAELKGDLLRQRGAMCPSTLQFVQLRSPVGPKPSESVPGVEKSRGEAPSILALAELLCQDLMKIAGAPGLPAVSGAGRRAQASRYRVTAPAMP